MHSVCHQNYVMSFAALTSLYVQAAIKMTVIMNDDVVVIIIFITGTMISLTFVKKYENVDMVSEALHYRKGEEK